MTGHISLRGHSRKRETSQESFMGVCTNRQYLPTATGASVSVNVVAERSIWSANNEIFHDIFASSSDSSHKHNFGHETGDILSYRSARTI